VLFTLLLMAAPAALQQQVDRVMSHRAGAAIVLDVDSGKVLACSNPQTAARRLMRPGSVIKPFTLLALMNAHRVRMGTALPCSRVLTIAKRRFDCSHPSTPLPLDATAAIAYSCNVFFTTFAASISPNELEQTFRRVGLLSTTGLLPGEATGWAHIAPKPADRQLQAIGEDGIEITPIALAESYRKLAARRKIKPPPDLDTMMIYQGLQAAAEYGTARLAHLPYMDVSGKTGTASAPGRPASAWFAGFAPSDNPRIVVVVFLEQGSGGRDAGPVGGELFRLILPPPQ
jgi:cell division protein FtsI/penicillin-binding protein 2